MVELPEKSLHCLFEKILGWSENWKYITKNRLVGASACYQQPSRHGWAHVFGMRDNRSIMTKGLESLLIVLPMPPLTVVIPCHREILINHFLKVFIELLIEFLSQGSEREFFELFLGDSSLGKNFSESCSLS